MKFFSVKIQGIIWLSSVLLLLCTVNNSEALNVTIEWDANAEAVDGYKLHYQADTSGPPFNGTGADQGPSPIDVGNVTTYSVTGLPDGPTYYFSVTAYKGELESGYSNVVSTGSTDTTAPTVTSANPASGSVDIGIDTAITAVFSEAMDASSITTTTFSLDNGATGTVSYDSTSRTARYSPSSSLNYNTIYTVTITTGVKDVAGNAIASNYSWSFTTANAPDLEPPSVSSTTPADSATSVSIDATVSVIFSEVLNCDTITGRFYLTGNGVNVSGNTTCFETEVTFTPSNSLGYGTTYTATLSAGISDFAGNAMVGYSWSFTTEADTTAPAIVSGLSGTAVSETGIDLSWAASTDNVGVTGYKIFRNGGLIGTSTTTSYSDTGLNAQTTYTYEVSGYDASDNESVRSSAVSVQTLDTTSPAVNITSPLSGAGEVAIDTSITASFSEQMDASTITIATFTLSVDGSNLQGIVTYSGTTATFTPSENLVSGQDYQAEILSEVQDVAGNSMASSHVWSFSTSPPSSDTTAPEAVTGLIIVSIISETGVNISWTPSTDNVAVTGYKVFRDGDLIGTSTTTSYSDTGLSAQTTYSYEVSAYDAAGNESSRSSQIIVLIPDTTAPAITITSPLPNADGVAIDTAITASFSEQMDAATITTGTFRVSANGSNLPGTVTYSGTTAMFTPSDDFEFSQEYLVLISTGVNDLAGNAMTNDYSWRFTAGTASDNIPPAVTSVSPAAGDTRVPVDVSIVAGFSESMAPDTLTTSTFRVNCGKGDVPSSVRYRGTSVTLNHRGSDLPGGTTCIAVITTGVQDLAGNPLASDYIWNFTTEPTSFTNHSPSVPILISPQANARGVKTDLTFSWNKSDDKDGDAVTYKLYYGTSLDFKAEDTQVIKIASTSSGVSSGNAVYAKVFGVPGMLLLGFAAVGALPKRKRDALMILLLLTGSLFLSQCGGGTDDSNLGSQDNGTTSISGEMDDIVSYEVTNLKPSTTYYWKVVASDGRGEETESEIRGFTTKAIGGISS